MESQTADMANLWHNANGSSQAVNVNITNVLAIDENATWLWIIESIQQPHNCWLTVTRQHNMIVVTDGISVTLTSHTATISHNSNNNGSLSSITTWKQKLHLPSCFLPHIHMQLENFQSYFKEVIKSKLIRGQSIEHITSSTVLTSDQLVH